MRRVKILLKAGILSVIIMGVGMIPGYGADDFTAEKHMMVEDQIKSRGVTDKRVLKAMEKVERHLFVPEDLVSEAYVDSPLPIGLGQTISQPYIVALMTEAARVTSSSRVLEIGTGCGYQAAVMGEIAGEVYTIEIIKELAEVAAKRLEGMGYKNIKVKCGDGYEGWPEYAPFDAIIVTASPPELPVELIDQLVVGGRMVIPVGSFVQELYVVTRTKTGYEQKPLIPVRFVPMVRGKGSVNGGREE